MTALIDTKPCQCNNCGHICAIEGLNAARDLLSRLAFPPSDRRCVLPAGECRRCGALAYELSTDDLATMEHADTTLQLVGIGEGSAYSLEDPMGAFGYEALITDWPRFAIPTEPDTATTSIAIYADGCSEPDQRHSIDLKGRHSMIRWYIENVGFDPDEDEGRTVPTLQLVERIATHLLLRAAGF